MNAGLRRSIEIQDVDRWRCTWKVFSRRSKTAKGPSYRGWSVDSNENVTDLAQVTRYESSSSCVVIRTGRETKLSHVVSERRYQFGRLRLRGRGVKHFAGKPKCRTVHQFSWR